MKATIDPVVGAPTTLRFSRRLGEATRGPEYAEAIEPPPKDASARAVKPILTVIALSLLAASSFLFVLFA